jgi:hypothetical protein
MKTPTAMPVIYNNLLLEFARMYVRPTSLERVLDSLGNAVSESVKSIDTARARGDEEHLNAIGEEESGVLESLVGTAFVVAQTHITGIVSAIIRLHEANRSQLTICDGKRPGILHLASPQVATSGFNRIEVIEALANYFKHGDEWTAPWSALKGRSASTVKVILAIGCKANGTGNLCHGLKVLGIDQDLLGLLYREVAAWGKAVISAYEGELKIRGLV